MNENVCDLKIEIKAMKENLNWGNSAVENFRISKGIDRYKLHLQNIRNGRKKNSSIKDTIEKMDRALVQRKVLAVGETYGSN